MKQTSVVVVGAGLAGLVAARRLAEAGAEVVVLEAAGTVGGRVGTEVRDGFLIDRGAQFLSAAYVHIPSLVRELGLADAWQPTSPKAAVVRDGVPRRISYRNPLSLVSGGLLRPREFAGLTRHLWGLRGHVRGRSLADYGAWADVDDRDAADWLAAEAGSTLAEYFYEPMLQGFYFQPLEGTSRALAMAVAAFGFQRPKTMSVQGGIGRIVEELAASLDIRTSSPVTRVEIDGDRVSVATDAERFVADYAVVATPAGVARELLKGDLTAIEQELLSCTYSATINVCLGLGDGYRLPASLDDVYGVLVPARERQSVAAFGIERNKARDRARHGHLVEAFLSGKAEERSLGVGDDEVVATVVAELERYLPGVGGAVTMTHLIRWPAAEPRSPVGRARAVAAYRRQALPDRRVLLAGDYVAFPWTDGATESGEWAAAELSRLVTSGADQR